MSSNCASSTVLDREAIIFCIVGAAASGKTTLITRLRAEYPQDTQRAISVTSRPIRAGEVEGQSYFFVSRAEFERRVAAGEFFEWEETHGNFYGTLHASIKQVLNGGCDLVLDIDIRGACNFQSAWPQKVVTVLIVPPSTDELLKRLKGRGAVSDQEIAARIKSAEREYQSFRDLHQSGEAIDYLIINGDLEVAYATLRSIVVAERSKISRRSVEFIARLCTIAQE